MSVPAIKQFFKNEFFMYKNMTLQRLVFFVLRVFRRNME